MIGMWRLGLACGLALGASLAWAEDFPDLKGTWKGTNEAVVLGQGAHHPNPGGQAGPRTTNTDFTVTFAGQDGRRFWGTIASPTATEPLLGVFASDRQTLYMADVDGYTIAKLTSDGKIDMCYLRSGKDMTLAACLLLAKQ